MVLFFHLHECGSIRLDSRGADVTNLEAAREIAYKQARSVMSAEVQEGRLCAVSMWRMTTDGLYLPSRLEMLFK